MLQSPTDLDLFLFLYNTLLLLSVRNGCTQFNAVRCITQNFPFGLSEHIAPLPGNPLGSRKLLAICVPAVPGWELLKSFVYAAYQVGEHPSYNSHSYHLTQTKGLSSSYLTVSCLFFSIAVCLVTGWPQLTPIFMGPPSKLLLCWWKESDGNWDKRKITLELL